MERDRAQTEQRLIDAVGELIEEKGFEKVGVNAVAERAGVSKMLIYRYFESLDGLLYEYVKKHDFLINTPREFPPLPEFKDFLKKMFRNMIKQFRENVALRRLRRWELSSKHPIATGLRKDREEGGMRLTEFTQKISALSGEDIAAVGAIISAGITYLAILEDNCAMFNGINIQTDEGWDQISCGIDKLIDMLY